MDAFATKAVEPVGCYLIIVSARERCWNKEHNINVYLRKLPRIKADMYIKLPYLLESRLVHSKCMLDRL